MRCQISHCCHVWHENLIHFSLYHKLRLPVASPRGGVFTLSKWHDIQMTENLGLVLCWRKVRFAHLPSPKYCILIFNFDTLEQKDSLCSSSSTKVLHPIFSLLVLGGSQVRFAHLPASASKYYILFFNFGTLMQSGSLRSPSCTKVLHPIFRNLVLGEVTSQYCFSCYIYCKKAMCQASFHLHCFQQNLPKMWFLSIWLESAKKLVCL